MDFRISKIFLTTLFSCWISFSAFAKNEAPVVDVQQDEASTHVESTGAAWQNMPNAKHNDSDNPQHEAQLSVQNETTQNTQSNIQNQPPEESMAPAPVGSIDQRVSRLEQQISNLVRMNLPQQINDLRQTISQLQGQLQVQDRDIKTLTTKQNDFYQDLQQQIAKLKKSNGTSSSSDMTTPETTSTPSTDTTVSDKMTLNDSDTYSKAFRLVSARHFKQAKTAFDDYLQKFPKGRFVASAYFWLGEIAMSNKDYDTAKIQFQTIISKYPASSKVPDAKLKLATVHATIGKTDLARQEFSQIKQSYPGTTAAQLASIRLQQMAQ